MINLSFFFEFIFDEFKIFMFIKCFKNRSLSIEYSILEAIRSIGQSVSFGFDREIMVLILWNPQHIDLNTSMIGHSNIRICTPRYQYLDT